MVLLIHVLLVFILCFLFVTRLFVYLWSFRIGPQLGVDVTDYLLVLQDKDAIDAFSGGYDDIYPAILRQLSLLMAYAFLLKYRDPSNRSWGNSRIDNWGRKACRGRPACGKYRHACKEGVAFSLQKPLCVSLALSHLPPWDLTCYCSDAGKRQEHSGSVHLGTLQGLVCWYIHRWKLHQDCQRNQ